MPNTKIIIISYYYAPSNIMAAIRMSKISKYLIRDGYDVTVVTSANNTLLFLKENEDTDTILEEDTINVPVIRVEHSRLYQYLCKQIRLRFNHVKPGEDRSRTQEAGYLKMKRRILHLGLFFLSLVQDYDFVHQGYKIIKKVNKKNDVIVISSYGPLGSHLLGLKIKKRNHFKWIADFRDPIAQKENAIYEYRLNKWYERKICKKADLVTAISTGTLKTIGYNKGQVITNGFDPEDLLYLDDSITNPTKYRIVYTGTLYSGKRDLSPLFLAIREIEKKDKNLVHKIEIIYAGVQEEVFFSMAKKIGVEQYVCSIGKVERKKALELQKSADLLVVATWNNVEGNGVLSGKFLEYLMFNTPILGLVSGKYCNSELKQRIDECNIGFCYEEGKNNNRELVGFLQNELDNYVKHKAGNGNRKIINRYSYSYITNQFIDIIKDKL